MSSEGPIRFYAVSHGRHDDYCEFYILATSPEDALRRYLRSIEQPYCNVVATVWEADIDDCGLIRKTKQLDELEIPGRIGYLWAVRPGEEDIDAKHGLIRCLLCGWTPEGDPPYSQESKDAFFDANGSRKCKECAKYKIWKP